VARDDTHRQGLIIAAHGRRGRVELESGGTRRYLVKGRKLRAVCGDRVGCSPLPHGGGVLVTEIHPRDNALRRPAPGSGRPEVLAANLSLLAVVLAPVPRADLFLIDRYLCAARQMDCQALLVCNKSDITDAEPADLEEYHRLGYSVLPVSAATGEGLEALAGIMDGQVGILVGQSGVGKSSLVNRLVPDAAARVAEISGTTAEGRHTTTASIMHRLPAGGRLIDTPGVRDFIPLIDDPGEVQAGFPEIQLLAGQCRFANCRHYREPDCAVRAAVADQRVSARRYESYRRLLRAVPQG